VKVTKQTALAGEQRPARHYISQSCKIVNSNNEPVLVFLQTLFPPDLVESLSQDRTNPAFQKLSKEIKDCRGVHIGISLGEWKERGGTGRYGYTPASKTRAGRRFVRKHKKLWRIAALVMSFIDGKYARTARKAHGRNHDFVFDGFFGFGVLNITSPQELHRDYKDAGWSCLIVLGDYSGGEVYFPYLGAVIAAKQGDALFMDSYLLWHCVLPYLGDRGSMVLTNHFVALYGHPRHKR